MVDRLISDGHRVMVFDNFTTGRRSNLKQHDHSDRLDVKEGSILDIELLDEAAEKCDRIIHLAAAVGVFNIVNDPLKSMHTNIRGSENIFQVALEKQIPVLIASSSEIYGKNTSDSLSEDDDRIVGNPQKLRWSYSDAKAIDEAMAFAIHRDKNLDVRVVRLFNTVGPRQLGKYGMVLPRFVNAALNNKPIEVYGSGTQTRCLAHVKDVINAFTLIEKSQETIGIPINVGSDQEITILELAHAVKEFTNSLSPIIHINYAEAYADGFEDMQRRVPNLSRLRRLTGWTQQFKIKDIIKDVVKYVSEKKHIDYI